MILIIRISGQVNVPSDIEEALSRLLIRKKYSAVLIHPTSSTPFLLRKLRNHIAYGDISHETLVELVKHRAKMIDKKAKLDAEKIALELSKKSPRAVGIKPFFRLHPPRKGIESKKHFGVGKGVLGDNKESINELVRRM